MVSKYAILFSYSNILRAEGQAAKAMMGQVIGNFLNVVLDPVMILGFGWDITGAACCGYSFHWACSRFIYQNIQKHNEKCFVTVLYVYFSVKF